MNKDNKNNAIRDFQLQQRHIGTNYYNFANDCSNPNLRNDFLSFAREESNIIDWLKYEYDENSRPEQSYISQAQRKSAYELYNNNIY